MNNRKTHKALGLFRQIPVACQQGFTLVEMLVSIIVLSIIMSGMFAFLWGASEHWQSGRDSADINDNARLGLNRMVREIRQSSGIDLASATKVTFTVDFGSGDETISYTFVPGSGGAPGTVVRTSSMTGENTLMEGVQSAEFVYYGNDYRCDTSAPYGVVTYSELQACVSSPTMKIARVDIVLDMKVGETEPQEFVGQAWLRNRPF